MDASVVLHKILDKSVGKVESILVICAFTPHPFSILHCVGSYQTIGLEGGGRRKHSRKFRVVQLRATYTLGLTIVKPSQVKLWKIGRWIY